MPAVKAIMARSIVEMHGLNEKQTADILGLSQSAVSRYISGERGNILNIETTAEIISLKEQMVTHLMREPNNKTEILELFCQICTAIRKKG